MSQELPLPPHLQHAAASLAEAGIPPAAMPHALMALKLAATYYQATTQVSRTDQLRKDRNTTQDELERVSAELVAVRERNQELTAQIGGAEDLVAASQQAAQRAADQQLGVYMSIVTLLRVALYELARTLHQAGTEPETKLKAARRQVAEILAGSRNRKHRLFAAQLLANDPA